MTPAAIIQAAAADGVRLALTEAGPVGGLLLKA